MTFKPQAPLQQHADKLQSARFKIEEGKKKTVPPCRGIEPRSPA